MAPGAGVQQLAGCRKELLVRVEAVGEQVAGGAQGGLGDWRFGHSDASFDRIRCWADYEGPCGCIIAEPDE